MNGKSKAELKSSHLALLSLLLKPKCLLFFIDYDSSFLFSPSAHIPTNTIITLYTTNKNSYNFDIHYYF